MKCWKGFVSPDIETVLSPLRAWNVSYFYVLHKTSTVPASQSGANHLPWCHVVCSSTSQASLLMLQNRNFQVDYGNPHIYVPYVCLMHSEV